MKAILVIDMPDACYECPCYRQTQEGGIFEDCKVTYIPLSPTEVNDIPEWCPLKPLPKRIPPNEYGYMTPYGSVWNACLDKIMGETEGNNGLKPLPKDESHEYYGCPSCRHIVSSVQNYCENCGQKLDWRDIGETE